MSTQGQGPLNDPRLVERRGDLSGLNALLFVILVVLGFLAAGFFLYTLITGSPAASPAASRTAGTTSGASPSASEGAASSSLAASAAPTVSASLPFSVSIGTPAEVIVDGQVAGQVTVLSAKYSRVLAGKVAPKGQHWLLVNVALEATGTLPFDENLWTAIDSTGTSYGWRGSDPAPSLGRGTLDPGATRTGNVTFQVPIKRRVSSLGLEADDGSPLVVVKLP